MGVEAYLVASVKCAGGSVFTGQICASENILPYCQDTWQRPMPGSEKMSQVRQMLYDLCI